MRRNNDLIRDVLLQIEQRPPGEEFNALTLDEGPDEAVLVEHLRLLHEAGFIKAEFTQYIGDATQPLDQITIERLTWKGHEFLDAIRSDSVWNKTKERVAKVGGSVSISTLGQIAGAIAKELMGLP